MAPLWFVCVVVTITVTSGRLYKTWHEFALVKDTILINDMTVTSCQSRCMVTPTCESVGLLKEPKLGEVGDCYLLKKGWHKRLVKVGEKNLGSIMLYVLITHSHHVVGQADEDHHDHDHDGHKVPETNIALGKPVVSDSSVSYDYYKARATDGKVDSVMYTRPVKDPDVTIDLGAIAMISKVYLFGTKEHKGLVDSVVSIGVTKTSFVQCGDATKYIEDATPMGHYDVTCPTKMKGRYVKMQLLKPKTVSINLFELEVYGVFL